MIKKLVVGLILVGVFVVSCTPAAPVASTNYTVPNWLVEEMKEVEERDCRYLELHKYYGTCKMTAPCPWEITCY